MIPIQVFEMQRPRVWVLSPLGIAVSYTVPVSRSAALPAEVRNGLVCLTLYLDGLVQDESVDESIRAARERIFPEMQFPFWFRVISGDVDHSEMVEK